MLKAMRHTSKAAKELRSTHRLPSRKFKIWDLWKDSAMYLFLFGVAISIGNIPLHLGRPQAFRSSGPFVVAQGLVVMPTRSRWAMLADRENNHCTVLSFPLSHAGKEIRPSTSCSFARTTCTPPLPYRRIVLFRSRDEMDVARIKQSWIGLCHCIQTSRAGRLRGKCTGDPQNC